MRMGVTVQSERNGTDRIRKERESLGRRSTVVVEEEEEEEGELSPR